MNESAIHISSVKREKIGVNKPHNFVVKFNPDYKHFLALDRLSMTYSWYKIRSRPEYIQLAHRLRDLGVITNNQLNKNLRSIYS